MRRCVDPIATSLQFCGPMKNGDPEASENSTPTVRVVVEEVIDPGFVNCVRQMIEESLHKIRVMGERVDQVLLAKYVGGQAVWRREVQHGFEASQPAVTQQDFVDDGRDGAGQIELRPNPADLPP